MKLPCQPQVTHLAFLVKALSTPKNKTKKVSVRTPIKSQTYSYGSTHITTKGLS